jgi:hypothetical protein
VHEEGLYIIRHTETSGIERNETLKEGVSLRNVNSRIEIQLTFAERENVKVEVYNIIGQKIEELINGIIPSGRYTLYWNGNPGVYFVRVEAGNKIYGRKAIIFK